MDSQETTQRAYGNGSVGVPQRLDAFPVEDALIAESRAMIGQAWTFEMQTRIERRLLAWERDNLQLLRENNELRKRVA